MDIDNIDVAKLQHVFLETDAKLLAQERIISRLQDEVLHLRQIIQMLITSKPSDL